MPRSRFLALGSLALVLVLVGMWFAIVPKSAESPDIPAQVVVTTTAPASAILSEVAAVQDTRTSEPVVSPNPAPEADANTPTQSRPSDGDAFEVHVVRDEDDQPIVGARTLFDDPSLPGLPPDQLTNAQGIAHWKLRGNRDWVVRVVAPGRVSVRQGVSKEAGSVTLRMRLIREIVVRLVDESGAALSPSEFGLDPIAADEIVLTVTDACGAPGTALPATSTLPFSARQMSWSKPNFTWNLLLDSTDSVCVHAVIGDRILAAQWIIPTTTEVALVVRRTEINRFAAPFVVRALADEDGRGLENIAVVVRTTNGVQFERITDSEGRARFEGVLAEVFDVEVSGDGRERTVRHVSRPIDEEVVFHAKAGRTIRGIAVDEAGRPCSSGLVAMYRASQPGSRVLPFAIETPDSNGSFVFTSVTLDAVALMGTAGRAGRLTIPLDFAGSTTLHLVPPGGDVAGIRVVGTCNEFVEWWNR